MLKQEKGVSVVEFVLEFCSFLEILNLSMEEEAVYTLFLSNLLPECRHYVESHDLDEEWDFEESVWHLTNAEHRYLLKPSGGGRGANLSSSSFTAASERDVFGVQCFKCKKKGHKAKQCLMEKNEE